MGGMSYVSDKYADTESTIASKRMFKMAGVTFRAYESQGKEIKLSV